MKYIFSFLLTLYQYLLSPVFTIVFATKCRYSESCSAFAKRVILEKGVRKGGPIALRRFLSCQPFGTIEQ